MADTPENRSRFPELFEHEKGQIDRRSCKRVVPMEVLALGLPRTGTSSLREALKILGYNDVHHMQSLIANPQEAIMWSEAADAKWFGIGKPFGREEFDMLLGHCQATCDWPSSAFYTELITAYPTAKIILNKREINAWHKSMTETIMSNETHSRMQTLIRNLITSLDTTVLAKLHPFFTKLRLGTLSTHPFSTCGKELYINHYTSIRTLVPAENLLEYTISEGWVPLCEFLEKEIPDVAFPRINDSADFKVRMRIAGRACSWEGFETRGNWVGGWGCGDWGGGVGLFERLNLGGGGLVWVGV